MAALLCALLVFLPQGPPEDEVAARFTDPVTADRAWEMAADYFGKIAGRLRAKEYDEARAWERRARTRLPDPYRKRLTDKGLEFWPRLQGYPGNRAEVEERAAVFIIALTGGGDPELAVLSRRAEKNPEVKRGQYMLRLVVAQTQWAAGDYPAALRHFESMEKEYKEEWIPKQLDEYRAAIAEIRLLGSGEALLKTTTAATWGRDYSWGGSLALLERARQALKSGPPGETRKSCLQAAIHVLKSLGDEKAVRFYEDVLAHDPVSSPEEGRSLLAKRAAEAFQKGNYKEAEALYRNILKRWPDQPAVDIAFELGRALQMQTRHADAREIFAKIVAAEAAGRPRGRREFMPSYADRARFEIGACFEGEGEWAKALEAYLACPDVPRPDGHGGSWRDLKLPEAVFRCRVKLRQNNEALQLGRSHVLEAGGCSPRIVVGYVDLAIAMGRFEAEEEKLRAAPAREDTPGPAMALECMRVQKLRSERDAAALFAMIREDSLYQHLYGAVRWETLRDGPLWLTVEAVECLAELGDQATEYLEPLARLGVGRSYVALLALCRVRTDRARKLMENLDWVQGHGSQEAGRFKQLAQGEPRDRARLAEKPAPAPEAREVARRKAAAAKFREKLPELTGKVAGIDELLARETEAGRLQALGEAIFAWKKGAIVDEDLEDLIALADDENWALDPKLLQPLIRNNRVAPAAVLIEPGLTSKDPRIRKEAVEILTGFKFARAVPGIAQMLTDPDVEVVRASINALVWMKAREHIPKLAAFLVKGPPEWRATSAIHALGRLAAVEQADAIADFLTSQDVGQRAAAAEALGRLGAKKHAGKIRPLLKDKNEWVRKAAEEALKLLEK